MLRKSAIWQSKKKAKTEDYRHHSRTYVRFIMKNYKFLIGNHLHGMSNSKFKTYLKNHPRAASLLFGTMVLLGQVGTVAAGNGVTYPGP